MQAGCTALCMFLIRCLHAYLTLTPAETSAIVCSLQVSCEEFVKAGSRKEWGYAEEMNLDHNTYAAGSPTPSQVKLQLPQPGSSANTNDWTFETRGWPF